jgi:hypothetical protein
MRFRSKKREKQYRTRRTLVEQLLDERRICERCGMNPSTDIHEVIRRSQWRDGINVLSNLRALCRACHRWVTEHPAKAVEEGWSDWSWNRDKYLNDEEGRPE